MASVVFNGRKKITFTANQSGTSGTANFSLTVQNGSSSASYISTGPIELWIGSQRITTGYSGYYSSCADSSYNSWYHSVNFATGNSSGTNARKFPAANGTITGTLDVGYGTHQMKMYVDYCYSNQKWTGTANVTLTNPDKTTFIGINQDSYIEMMSKTQYRLPTWSDTGGQDDLVWHDQWSGSWTRGEIAYPWAFGGVHSNASLDDAWNTHVYTPSNSGVGTYYYYPRIYVKYNANGGSSTPSTQTKYIGSKLTLASAISRTHYTFKGWSTSSTATSASYSAGQVIDYEAWNSISAAMSSNSGWTTYTPTHSGNNITLYAVWAGNTYKVSYNANSGSSTPSAQSTTYPNSVKLASAISRNNSTSKSNGTITISYNTNGGSTAPSASTGTYTNTTTTKYTFEKWHLNSATGTAYAAGASYKPTGNVTMYAGWTSSSSTARTSNPSITLTSTKPTKSNSTVSSYTVAYNANGGSSTPSTQTATKTRKYTFSKWNSKSDGTGTDYNSATAYTFSANATLYAKYTTSDSGGSVNLASAISRANGSTSGYSVTYNANGGSGAPSSQTSGNRTVTYTFNKWASGSTSGTQYAAGASYTPTANTTMYAIWSSSTSSNSSWTCSSTVPTRDGYTFKGWSTSSTATTASYTAGSTYTITSGLTLYAVWEANARVRVKVNNAWKLGTPYVKVNGQWKKAKKVYIKVNGVWKESKSN